MRFINWIWTDDKTGKFSDTTFRTWILFFLFVSCVIYFVFIDIQILPEELSLMNILAIAALGQGGLYLGKRINESSVKRTRIQAKDDLLEKIQSIAKNSGDLNTRSREL